MATTSTVTTPQPSLVLGTLLAAAALALAAVGWWPVAPTTPPPAPLLLKSFAEALPGETMKSYRLHVPYAGQLTLEIEAAGAGEFTACLVRVEDTLELTRGGELDLLTAFSAEHTRHCRRVGPIAAGTYHLTLANLCPRTAAPALPVTVRALLAP